jgi:hypothetical protein
MKQGRRSTLNQERSQIVHKHRLSENKGLQPLVCSEPDWNDYSNAKEIFRKLAQIRLL